MSFNGSDQVVAGNGNSLSIIIVGKIHLLGNINSFKLNKEFHVPSLIQNLINVLLRIKLGGLVIGKSTSCLTLQHKIRVSIVALTVCELMWIQSLLRDIGQPCFRTLAVFCDNLSTMHLAANPVMHSRSKHVEIDYHFVREKVQNKSLLVQFTLFDTQPIDGLTKPLVTQSFTSL